MRLTLRAVLLAVLLALLTAGPALASDGGLAPVAPHSPNAAAIRDTYWLILGITGVIFVLVEGTLVVFVVRYRRGRRSRETDGAQVHGHTRMEIVWTVVPVMIVAAIIGFVFAKLPDVQDVPPASAADSLSVKVEAHQFYWMFTYPNGAVSIDTMEVPVGKVVTLTVVAADVVHGWWIPSLGGQIDAIPGRTNHTWFRAPTTPGTFTGQCSQLCGVFHAKMFAAVKVVPEATYQAFVASHAVGSQAVAAQSYVGVCSKCHGMNGVGDYGPALQGRTFDTGDITLLLRQGRTTSLGHMPAVGSDWSNAQITAMIAYLRKIKGGSALGG
ncbi:MAG TPA: cytochrome c oxidase subunit II [Gaiellaceae bacterium]|nr:cytochrome c oxidase subunit II [Gaiellaceae bacterium]